MSFNQLLVDQPEPEIAGSAVVLGEVHVGAGAILAQGLVVRAHGAAVSIGNYSAVLENGVVIGTPEHPVRVGQRTVFGHRATIVGATIGDLCEIGNGAILMPGSRLGDGCILGEGTLVPPDTVIPTGSVLVGRPPHVIRSATDADRERLAVLRQHQTDLTDHPGTIVHGPMRAGERMGTLYAYRDKTPSIGAGTVLFDSAEITGDVVIGERLAHRRRREDHRRLARPGPHRLPGADPGEHGAAPAARQRADHRRRRGHRPGRDDPRLPHRPRAASSSRARSCATAAWSVPSRSSAPVRASSSATGSVTGRSSTGSRPGLVGTLPGPPPRPGWAPPPRRRRNPVR